MNSSPPKNHVSKTSQPEKFQPCPQCATSLPVFPGYTTWCDQCGWNLKPEDTLTPTALSPKIYLAISQKSSERLFSQMLANKPDTRRTSAGTILAFLIAGSVHSITLAFCLFGVALCIMPSADYRFFGILLGLVCFTIAAFLFPRFGKPSGIPLPKNEYPTLYRIVDRITDALGGSKVDAIVPSLHFNASFARIGWKRKRVLTLGLPLFAVLAGEEKVALLGHELAHSVNGDPSRTFLLGSAIYSLSTWYDFIHPRNRWHVNAGFGAIFLLVINIVSLPIAYFIWLICFGLIRLSLHDSQRSEYLADYLGAKIGGTDASLRTLRKAQLWSVFRLCLKKAYLLKQGDRFLSMLDKEIQNTPTRELERIKRINSIVFSQIDTPHPPTARRMDFLDKHHMVEPQVLLSPAELSELEAELAPLYQQMQERVFSLDDKSFRELYGISW